LPVLGHRRKPGEELFVPFNAEIETARLGAPSADLSGQFDIDRYLLDGRGVGVGVENHDDNGALVEMGVEVPPFSPSAFYSDALTVLKIGDFNRAIPGSL
jgi:hypothetical protein